MTEASKIREIFENLRDYLELIAITDQKSTIFEWKRDESKKFDQYLLNIRDNYTNDGFFDLDKEDYTSVNIRINDLVFSIVANFKDIYKVLEVLLADIVYIYHHLDSSLYQGKSLEGIVKKVIREQRRDLIRILKASQDKIEISNIITQYYENYIYFSSPFSKYSRFRQQIQDFIKKKIREENKKYSVLEALLAISCKKSDQSRFKNLSEDKTISNLYQNRRNSVSSGDTTLDELLGGEGFEKELLYLLCGDKKICTNILLNLAVISQKDIDNIDYEEEAPKVAFFDGNNRFNPYHVSKFAVSQNLHPKEVLENILIACALPWNQMVDILENDLPKLENVKVVLISGITSLFESYEKHSFEDLLKEVNEIKTLLNKTKPLIVISAPIIDSTFYKPKSEKLSDHFGNVLVMINDDERYTEYILVQHPTLPENRLLKRKRQDSKRESKDSAENTTLDSWI